MSQERSRRSRSKEAHDERELSPVTTYSEPWLALDSMAELKEKEEEILARIDGTLNGGVLFLTHPLRFFDDIGLSLSAELQADMIRKEPRLGALSDTVYNAIRESRYRQPVHVNVETLFPLGDE